MPENSLQTRIVALFLTLIVIVQLGGAVVVNSVGDSAARRSIVDDLAAGADVFDRVREQERSRLMQRAGLLSAEPDFRRAIAARDAAAMTDVLGRYGRRTGAELLMVVRRDDVVVADTLRIGVGEPFPFPRLVNHARETGQAAAMVVVRGRLYQLVVVPIVVPGPYAWVAAGYAVDEDLARETGALLRLDVSFASRFQQGEWRLHASTLAQAGRNALLREMARDGFVQTDGDRRARHAEATVALAFTLPAQTDDTVAVVLQQPVTVAMEPFRRLQRQLAWISVCAILISIVASVLIARGIARPVRALAASARRMAAGDYSTIPDAAQGEIGDLATAFRALRDGLASREQRITNLAYRDTLTGLPNRTLYAERLDRALASAEGAPARAAVLLMDLDHFKDVNDTLGHAIGDRLLLEVAARIERVVERTDDTAARLGGDEFALLLPGQGAEEARRVADAVLRALEIPMILDGHPVDVRASIGIAVAPEHGSERPALMRRADVAMYAAKRNNQGVLVWDDRYDRHSRERLTVMGDLRRAVGANELALMYQPKVPLGDAGDHYVEALVRWQHPARGLVPPNEFIPLAEQTGFIRAITQWVLSRAIAQCAAWRRDGLPVHVSINISPRDLMDIRLPERFAELLQAHGCAAHWIALEITESAIMDDPSRAIDNLGRLHALGCRLAIDDFGTGYSSLAYLRRLPVDELKIDKSFVMNMAKDASDAMIVRSTIDLAHNMGLAVVAEGVDDEAVLERLRTLGCDMAQGYLLSRPLPPAEVPARLLGLAGMRASASAKALRRVG
jgi:diguanylate cyclase (GGDEF)-like protein